MSKKIKLKNCFFINPFFAYSISWIVSVIAYIISPAKINLPLDNNLLFFIFITSFISFFFGIFFQIKFRKKLKINPGCLLTFGIFWGIMQM